MILARLFFVVIHAAIAWLICEAFASLIGMRDTWFFALVPTLFFIALGWAVTAPKADRGEIRIKPPRPWPRAETLPPIDFGTPGGVDNEFARDIWAQDFNRFEKLPDVICDRVITAAKLCVPRVNLRSLPEITDDDILAIEAAVGMGASGWDCISPRLIVRAALEHFIKKSAGVVS